MSDKGRRIPYPLQKDEVIKIQRTVEGETFVYLRIGKHYVDALFDNDDSLSKVWKWIANWEEILKGFEKKEEK